MHCIVCTLVVISYIQLKIFFGCSFPKEGALNETTRILLLAAVIPMRYDDGRTVRRFWLKCDCACGWDNWYCTTIVHGGLKSVDQFEIFKNL